MTIQLDPVDTHRNNQYFKILNGNELHRIGVLTNKLYQLNIILSELSDSNVIRKSNLKVIVGYQDAFDALTTNFYKHGQSGIIDSAQKIKPCNWYDKQHPFEFEFVMADNPTYHKIFENLQLVSNKEMPESFHYEIIGEVYDFAEDKKNMYFRQEATKHLYQYNNYDILYKSDYLDIIPSYNPKSTMFPTYYSRIDNFEDIYDSYQGKLETDGQLYYNLSGSEIVYDDQLGEYKIATHVKASDIRTVGRLRGNMNYQEDKWLVQIPSITFLQKNEIS